MINENLYYSLKHFCNYERLDYFEGMMEELWMTPDWVCKFEIDYWKCEGDEYRQRFTYHHKSLANPKYLIDNYTTQKLYDWLKKR